jgi:phospholipid N-methyltransferase
MGRARPRLLFARHFLANPRGIGSMIPSSRRLTQRLLAGIDWPTAKVVVEYGPGTGVVTRAILAQMSPDARLYAFEINDEFVEFLRRAIADPRLIVVAASAETVASVLAQHGHDHCDAAISSLPFSIMPPRVRLRIIAATAKVLASGAAMVGYQYSTRWLRELRRSFGIVDVAFEPRNWPPAFVFTARCEPLPA